VDSILWDNTGDDDISGGSYTVTYTCIQQAVSGTGNIHSDPRFVTGPEGDYYLSQIAAGQASDSPCVDAGSDTAAALGLDVYTTRTDYVGDANAVDMGYHYPIIPGDLNIDFIVNFLDFAILASQWKDVPGTPSADIAPPGGDGIVDFKDLGAMLEDWVK
jgi:hypothetical protein